MVMTQFRWLRGSRRIRWAAAMVVAVALIASITTFLPRGSAQSVPKYPPVRVTGTLRLVVPNAPTAGVPSNPIALPDQKVTLRRVGGNTVASADTALDGRFNLMAPQPGYYQVCWSIAGSSGCSKTLVVQRATVGAENVDARIEKPVLYGLTLTGDNRPCWINDAFFKLDVSTSVSAGGRKTRANIRGEYAIAGLPPGSYTVESHCENAHANAKFTLSGASVRVDLPLGNHAPRLTSLYVTDGAKALFRAPTGTTIKLATTTRDPDGDAIEYLWRAPDAGGTIGTGNGPSESWKLPAESGQPAAYVLARDGRGGYAFRRIDIRTGNLDLSFSGQVLDEVSRVPLEKATVSVDGASATTDANGWFSLAATPRNDDRYVLNITRAGYAAMSRVYDKDATGTTYEMIRAQMDNLPASGVVTITDTRGSGPCGVVKGDDRQPPLAHLVQPAIYRAETDKPDDPETAIARRRGDAAALAAASEPAPCDARGIQIVIAVGSLVDAELETAPLGGIHTETASINTARRALPGDYQALPTTGNRSELLSYGAVYAEFTDSTGRKLKLKSGASAEIRVPVSPEAKPTAPPTIDIWSYDDKSGLWLQEGQGFLQNTPSGWMYVGKTAHFSTLNMDVAGNDPAHATCVRVEVGPDFAGWSNLTLRAYVSYGGAPPPKVKEVALDQQQYHAIYRIPFQTGFPNSLRLELRGTANNQQVVLLDNIINTDLPPHHAMTTPDLWPPYPYTDCTPVLLTAAPGVVPPYGDVDGFGRPAFLAGPFGQYNPPDGDQQATTYYAAIDPGTHKGTLGGWWDANGLDANGVPKVGGVNNPDYVSAVYLNNNDLGFGRNMHCFRNAPKIACYVTNYGLPDQNPQNANDAENQTNPGATVAMEYDPAAGADAVQFYVYGAGAQANSARLKFADLDGLGPKPVPFLCQVCHGGGPGLDNNNEAQNAHFREFDLPSFRYSNTRTWDYGEPIGPTTPTQAEFDKFAKLNQFVRDANLGNPIADLINAWYPGNNFTGQPTLPSPPAGWSGHANEYRLVYGQSCRSCHVARDFPDFISNPGFNYFTSSYPVSKVCGSGNPKVRVMPNASVTYRNFWADTNRVLLYETLSGIPTGSCKS
jgi:hypothetical protein